MIRHMKPSARDFGEAFCRGKWHRTSSMVFWNDSVTHYPVCQRSSSYRAVRGLIDGDETWVWGFEEHLGCGGDESIGEKSLPGRTVAILRIVYSVRQATRVEESTPQLLGSKPRALVIGMMVLILKEKRTIYEA